MPLMLTLQPNNSRNTCTTAINAKIPRAVIVNGFMALPSYDEALRLAWAARFPKALASTYARPKNFKLRHYLPPCSVDFRWPYPCELRARSKANKRQARAYRLAPKKRSPAVFRLAIIAPLVVMPTLCQTRMSRLSDTLSEMSDTMVDWCQTSMPGSRSVFTSATSTPIACRVAAARRHRLART